MSRGGEDGSLSDVNPDLLELSKDPVAWREQRRRALQEKVFARDKVNPNGGSSSGGGNGASNAFLAESYLPVHSNPTGAMRVSGRTPAEQEAYVLQQIMSHKRRRDEAITEAPVEAMPLPPSNTLSTKERLLQQLRKGK